MDFDFGSDADALRTRLRDLITAELPAGLLGAFTDDPADLAIAQRVCKRLVEEGLLTRAWPSEYGGRDGSVWEQTVVREEMWAHHEPRGAQNMGLNWVGPAIIAFGSDEQKAFHLGAIAAGNVIWSQGFSKPDAGSDLAASGLRGSMGRVASAGDNAAMESFHAFLQKNVLNRRTWRTRDELRYEVIT
jgi:alkylation response protein AidB-like acyl-CoA dehydrogenase